MQQLDLPLKPNDMSYHPLIFALAACSWESGLLYIVERCCLETPILRLLSTFMTSLPATSRPNSTIIINLVQHSTVCKFYDNRFGTFQSLLHFDNIVVMKVRLGWILTAIYVCQYSTSTSLCHSCNYPSGAVARISQRPGMPGTFFSQPTSKETVS